MKTIRRIGLGLMLVALLGACTAGRQAFDDGQQMIESGRIEDGLASLEQALRENGQNVGFKSYYARQKELYVGYLLGKGEQLRAAKQYADAEASFRRVFKYEASNRRATDGIEAIRQDKLRDDKAASAEKLLKAGKTDEALELAHSVLAEDPRQAVALKVQRAVDEIAQAQKVAPGLGAVFKKPITLEFRDANLRAIFEVISRATQINFVFDRDVRPDLKATIFVKNTTIEDVINLLMVTNQLDKRVLNENTVLIYPNTPAKAKDYQELVVRAFYLANADVKQTLNMIKTLVKTRDVFIDEKLNLLVMKDTPDAIRLAEKLIAAQDRAEPEVMLEVEVLEVSHNRLLDLGIQYPNTFTALNIANTNTTTTSSGTTVAVTPSQTQNIVTVDTLRHLVGGSIAISPNLQVNVNKQDGDAQILANPRIRVKNKEKAKIHIGDKVPVITTTSTANVGVSESVTYLDVGLKLDVEPQVYLDSEVGIKVGLEVSNIVREIRSQTGTLTYQVGTRNANTVLRLKDGETQVLAGLINDEDRKSASKIPGLGDLPLIGHLFSTHRDQAAKTEIILLITPHIIRNLTRLEANQGEFSSGTESAIGSPALNLRKAPTGPAPAPGTPGGAAPVKLQDQSLNGVPTPAAPPAAPIAMSLVAPPGSVSGQEFNVLVQASANSDIKAMSFDLVFDERFIDVVRVSEGAFMKQGNGETRFQSDQVEGGGRLSISIERKSGGVRGSGAVAVIVLRGKGDDASPTQIGIENPRMQDASGAPLNASMPTSVTVALTP
jgi:general secretion pathway protein D